LIVDDRSQPALSGWVGHTVVLTDFQFLSDVPSRTSEC